MCESFCLLEQLNNFPASEDVKEIKIRDLLSNYCTLKPKISTLKTEIQLTDDSQQRTLETQLRRLDYNFKKLKSALALELMNLARKKVKITSEYSHLNAEYESLLGEVITEAMNLICSDLSLNKKYSLISNIVNWITKIKPLRLFYKWKDIIAAKNPSSLNEVFSDDSDSELIDLLEDDNSNNNFDKKLEEIRNLETNKNIIAIILKTIPNLELNCQKIFQTMIEQVEGETKIIIDVILQEIANQTNSKKATIRSQYERNCLPAIYKAIIDDYSPNILNKSTPETVDQYAQKDALFKRYIEEDIEKKLSDCYLNEHTECNAQNLCKQLLPIFGNVQLKTFVYQEYNINREQFDRFWKLKVFRLLVKIVVDDLNDDDDYFQDEDSIK